MNKDFHTYTKNIFGPLAYKAAVATLVLFICLGTLAPFICNDRPLLAKTEHGYLFPWSHQSAYSNLEKKDIILSPIIPFSNKTIDKLALNWKAPLVSIKEGSPKHIMGSSKLGKDVFAGMIYGARTALFIGILSMCIAFFIGSTLGMLAGYYQNTRLRLNGIQIITNSVLIIYILYYFFYGLVQAQIASIIISLLLITLMLFINSKLSRLKWKKFQIPIDTIIIKMIEIRKSIPLIYLLLAATAVISKQGIWMMSAIIGLAVWVPFARHSRAGTLALSNEGHVLAAKSLGLKDFTILRKHILKDLLPQLLVVTAFGMSGAILLESSLSFLGMGMPIEGLTWGSMLAEAKQKPSAWWMAVYPGLGIFLTVLASNIIGERWSNQKRD